MKDLFIALLEIDADLGFLIIGGVQKMVCSEVIISKSIFFLTPQIKKIAY